MADYVDVSENNSVIDNQDALRTRQSGALLAFAFTASMLISALLLFFIQPMFAKMALPMLGGSSGVWNTAMVFFQAVLLGGYLYAHLLSKFFRFYNQVLIHGMVMVASIVFLPIAVPLGWEVPQSGTPTLWLIGLFGVALGVPFFALSANAPLMQKWFSYTNHRNSGDPYFLYAASNVGSLFSLLSYPVLIEPFFRVSEQSLVWAVGFVALIIAIMACGLLAYSHESPLNRSLSDSSRSDGIGSLMANVITWKDRVLWSICSIVPSGLMLGVTAHITSNIASAPFLWVVPLALYLLTFIIAFSPRPFLSSRLLTAGFPYIAGLMIFSASFSFFPVLVTLALILFGFFWITQMCHNRLAENRPATSHLTEFYFFMSLGGVLGGATVALLAPVLLNGPYEYMLMIIAACLVLPSKVLAREVRTKNVLTFISIIIALCILISSITLWDPKILAKGLIGLGCAYIVAEILVKPDFMKKGLLLTGVWAFVLGLAANSNSVIFLDRSFFGIARVDSEESEYGTAHLFIHGNTIHNVQLRDPDAKNYPLAYYAPEGSFAQAIDAVRADKGSINVAAIGLGAGALACHVEQGDNWTFYEIDPLVLRMARDSSLFSFLNDCAPNVPVVLGDARLTLQDLPKGALDLVIVDAFSSDAIPAHLVTVEALEMYRSLLKDDGFIFFHTSNRSLDISSVVINIAEAGGVSSRVVEFYPDESMKYHKYITASHAVMVGKEESLARIFSENKAWTKQAANPYVGLWSDDFSHIVGALIAKNQ